MSKKKKVWNSHVKNKVKHFRLQHNAEITELTLNKGCSHNKFYLYEFCRSSLNLKLNPVVGHNI